MTKEQLREKYDRLRDENDRQAEEIAALYDIFTAVREAAEGGKNSDWIIGYIGGIGGTGDPSRGNLRLLHMHAADIRRGIVTAAATVPWPTGLCGHAIDPAAWVQGHTRCNGCATPGERTPAEQIAALDASAAARPALVLAEDPARCECSDNARVHAMDGTGLSRCLRKGCDCARFRLAAPKARPEAPAVVAGTVEQERHRLTTRCECGHIALDHHLNQVTGDTTYCNECPGHDIGHRFTPAKPALGVTA